VIVLGIETSCDESAVSLLRFDESITILAEEISSQTELHEAYGGVVPELASREHLKNLPLLLSKVLNESGTDLQSIDSIAVTRGPGLKGCLLIGVCFAKGLSLAHEVPLIGVNHIEGHVFSCLLENPDVKPPFLSLIVSGGHTEILVVEELGNYKVVARTIDDAAGEAFDKAANLLNFVYPGGAKLGAAADSFGPPSGKFVLPKVMREAEGFSFSGLKTAIALLIKKSSACSDGMSSNTIGDLASTIQEAITETLVHKLQKAVNETGISKIAVAGGVSANARLRKKCEELTLRGAPVTCYFSSRTHCMDNASMIALVGGLRAKKFGLKDLSSGLSMDVVSRWPLEGLRAE